MQKKYLPLVALIVAVLGLTACATRDRQEQLQTDMEVLKTQLSRHQQQMADQQALLDALLDRQTTQASQQDSILRGIRKRLDNLDALAREPDKDRDTSESDAECPVLAYEPGFQPCTDLTIIGALEVIQLQPPGRRLRARVDTGANTSSVDARDIEFFESDGEEYVRFRFPGDMVGSDDGREYELPVTRFVRIIQAGKEDDRRAVVELKFRLGSVERMAEFTLTDRGKLSYRILIGRNILKDFFAVDVSEQYLITDRSSSGEGDAGRASGEEDDTNDEEAAEDGSGASNIGDSQ